MPSDTVAARVIGRVIICATRFEKNIATTAASVPMIRTAARSVP